MWGHNEPPKANGRYLVTAVSSLTKKRYVAMADMYEYPKGNFTWQGVLGGSFSDKVIAWQKLPEPYKGD